MLRRILFVVGLLLCVYSLVGNVFEEKEKKEIASENMHILGDIEIPKIQVHLPIYQEASEETLKKGVGHVTNSSPLGQGNNTHSLLAGHRGLPGAALLARLGELEIGDFFYINLAKQSFVYQVCQIQTLKPNEVEELQVEQNRERVSLITCTPYGINTHRLVVTGERIR